MRLGRLRSACGERHPDANGDRHGYTNRHCDGYGHTNPNRDQHADRDSNGHGHTNEYTCTDGYANRHCDRDTCATDGNGYSHADPDCDGN